MSELQSIPFLFSPEPVVRIQQLLGLGWPLPWRIVSLFGTAWGVIFVAGLCLWLWGRRAAYAVLAVVAFDGVVKMLLNQLIHVPRPSAPEIVKYERVAVGAFPSGHTATAASLWGYLATEGRVRWLVAAAVITLVAVSRLYLGVHYIGDLLGGVLLATFVVAVVRWAWPHVCRRLERVPFALWAVAALLVLGLSVAAMVLFLGGNPYRWRVTGMIVGLMIAMPLEFRFVGYRPGAFTSRRAASMVLIGSSGIAAFAAIDMVSSEGSDILGMLSACGAAIWAMLAAPTIFTLAGWAERDDVGRHTVAVAKWLAGTAALVTLVLAYGFIEPRHILGVERQSVVLDHLPASWEGSTIAVVSDLQLGMWLGNEGMMRRAIRHVVEQRPAAVLLAGDFLYHPGQDTDRKLEDLKSILRPLTESRIPAFAVMGNHDWGLANRLPRGEPDSAAALQLIDALAASGIVVLQNEAAEITGAGGEPLLIVGIGSRYAQQDSSSAALREIPADVPRVVMMHHPDSFENVPAGAAPLAVAGHTHGGQMRMPFAPEWSWLTFVRDDAVHSDGWIDRTYGKAGNRLYVTRGIGMSLIPLRFNCPPEVTYFTLHAPA